MSAASRFMPFLLTTFPLLAQDAGGAPQRPPTVMVSMSFAGGTLADFAARVRAAEPKANILVADDAALAKLPPLELRGAGLAQALEAACVVAEAPFQVRVAEFRGDGEPVYSLVAMAPQTTPLAGLSGSKKAPEDSTQVFSLNRLTDDAQVPHGAAMVGFRVETILSAIEAGTQDGKVAPVLRYHRDSGLLIVRGTREQIAIVKDILSSLDRDVETRRRQRSAEHVQPAADAKAATDQKNK